MPADLVEYLRGDDKVQCLGIFNRHTLWQYSTEAPYSPKDKALIFGCLGKIRPHLALPRDSAAREYDVAMIENLKRICARDFKDDVRSRVDRDQSMYMNFQWLMARRPAHSKVIVWTATESCGEELDWRARAGAVCSVGVIHRARNSRVTRSFLASPRYSGTYGMAGQPVRPLPAAPANSLEGRAFDTGGSDTRYINPSELRKVGPTLAHPLGPGFTTANWGDVLDGLVVFREERPPLPSTQPSG